ncbi:CYFA0S01e17480g1_1 [Cyberlindnera fabianii]|uniref:CYFA0S01e17480g1_1 n=1 Tax=Cyberlindnera fabianii TaxID=36022 RepID=A0A061AJQ9_CYBFA|nr:CYFA0S01e17480g1_1 [Cyberlindnera fabianii]
MGEATWQGAAINLLNTIIGAGMLAMPYAIRSDGIFIGVLVIILSAMTSSFGLYLQGKCAKYTPPGQASFFSLSQITYPQLGVVFDLAIVIKCFGVGVSYLVVIGDLMPQICETLVGDDHPLLLERNFWITIFMAFIVAPLSYLKKMDSLKFASMVALSSVAYLVILVFVHFFKHDIQDKGPVRIFKPYSATSILTSFPIVVFGYTCHQNMFTLINELNSQSGKIVNKVIFTAIGIAMSLYILVGLTGYISFGDKVGPNIIVGYTKSLSSTIGRVAIVILVMLSYPLQCHPARLSVGHIIHYFRNIKEISRRPSRAALLQEQRLSNSSSPGSRKVSQASVSVDRPNRAYLRSENDETAVLMSNTESEDTSLDLQHELLEQGLLKTAAPPLSGKSFYIVTTIIVTLSYLVAISVTSLAHVLAFVGSTGSTSISFILPGVFGYQLIGSEFLNMTTGEYENIPKKIKLLRYGAAVLSAWGVLVMVVCLSATIFLGATH